MKEKITAHQFFIIMFLLPYGSAVLFYLSPETKTDIWIGILAYGIIFVIIQMIYISLFNKYPNDSIVMYLPKIYGKFIGYILSVIYIWYFSYVAYRVLRDFMELTTSFNFIRMPMYVVAVVFMIVVVYSVYKGIENIGNMVQLALIIIIGSSVMLWILLIITGNIIHGYNILPILHDGLVPVMSKGWKLIMLPYSEFVAMTMLYPFVMEKTKVRKTVIFAVLTEAVMLALNNILFILALGYEFASSNNYPLLETLRLVHIGDFLNRLDIIFIVILMLGGFFKISIFMYCSVLGAVQLFNIKSWGLLCIVFGTLICASSITMSMINTYPKHLSTGLNHIPLSIIIPLLSLIVYYLKKLISSR